MNISGNSDPGTSGLLSPFGKISGLYFDDSPEKDDFMFQFQKDLAEIEKEHGIAYIKLDFDSENDFYNTLMKLNDYLDDNVKLYGTSKTGHYEVVVEAETDDDDENSTLQSSALRKKKKKSTQTSEEQPIEEA